jgi:hypothetical protein
MQHPQFFESVKLTVEAIQWDGKNTACVLEFANTAKVYRNGMGIATKEGQMVVSVGDYVVKEPYPTGDRDFYPVKEAIFLKRYRPSGKKSNAIVWYGLAIMITALVMGFGFGLLYAVEFYKH